MSLLDQSCKQPGIGDIPFSPEQAEQLRREVRDWTLEGAEVKREYRFKDFREAMAFVNEVADLAEGQGHHPDIFISYKTVRLVLTTHKIGGLSQNDFIMAAKIDHLQALFPFDKADQANKA